MPSATALSPHRSRSPWPATGPWVHTGERPGNHRTGRKNFSGPYLGTGSATFILHRGRGALGALPAVIVGHPRRYSPWLTHDLEKDG
jgi:hypothetical protein